MVWILSKYIQQCLTHLSSSLHLPQLFDSRPLHTFQQLGNGKQTERPNRRKTFTTKTRVNDFMKGLHLWAHSVLTNIVITSGRDNQKQHDRSTWGVWNGQRFPRLTLTKNRLKSSNTNPLFGLHFDIAFRDPTSLKVSKFPGPKLNIFSSFLHISQFSALAKFHSSAEVSSPLYLEVTSFGPFSMGNKSRNRLLDLENTELRVPKIPAQIYQSVVRISLRFGGIESKHVIHLYIINFWFQIEPVGSNKNVLNIQK